MSDLGSFVKRLRDIMRNDAGINGDAQRIEQIAWMLFLKVYDSQEENWEFDIEDYESIIPEAYRWRNWAVDDGKGTALTGDKLLNFVNNELFPTLKGLEVDAETPINKAIVKTTFEDANQYMKDGVLLRQVLNIIDGVDFGDYEESHAFGDIYESILKELQSAGSAGEFYTPRAVTDFMAEMIKPQIGESMADFACGTGGFLVSWIKQLQSKVTNTDDAEALGRSIYGIEKKQFPYMLCVTNMLLHGVDVPRVYHDNSLLKDVLDYTEKDQFDVILMNPPYGGSEKADVKSHFPADLASSETVDLFMSVIMYRLKESGRAAVVLPDNFLNGLDNTKIAIKKKLLSEFNLHTIIRLPKSVFSPYTPIATNLLFFDKTGPTSNTWFYRLDMPNGYKHFSKTKPILAEHFKEIIDWWNNRITLENDNDIKSHCYSLEELKNNDFDLDLCKYPSEDEEILDPIELISKYHSEREELVRTLDKSLGYIEAKLKGQAVESLQFEQQSVMQRLVNLNATFPEKLHLAILQKAFQGRLTETISSDTSIDNYIEVAIKNKDKLIREGVVKKGKKHPPINEEELPFSIPDTWRWVRLGDVFQHNTGKALNSSNTEGTELTYITTSNLYWDRFELEKLKKMPFTEAEISKCTVRKGDLLVNEGGDFGRAAVWNIDEPMRIQNHIHRLRSFTNCNIRFFYHLFYLYKKSGMISGKGIGLQGLSSGAIDKLIIPIAPYEEQSRVVSEIEKLLEACAVLA